MTRSIQLADVGMPPLDVAETLPSVAAAEFEARIAALLAAGRDVFVQRGYQNTRVDDLVKAAGVSHGAFYRYFRNKEELARILTVRGVRAVGAVVTEMPALYVIGEPNGKIDTTVTVKPNQFAVFGQSGFVPRGAPANDPKPTLFYIVRARPAQ